MHRRSLFATDRLRATVARHPEWRTTEPFRSVLAEDRAQLVPMGEKGMLEIVAAAHAGLTTEEFRRTVLDWLAIARHPRFERPCTDLVYRPMLQRLAWLRADPFETCIARRPERAG